MGARARALGFAPQPKDDPETRFLRPILLTFVANRGEVAVRVIRALDELDIEAVAVYSRADEGSMHVRMADQAVRIGPPARTPVDSVPNGAVQATASASRRTAVSGAFRQ